MVNSTFNFEGVLLTHATHAYFLFGMPPVIIAQPCFEMHSTKMESICTPPQVSIVGQLAPRNINTEMSGLLFSKCRMPQLLTISVHPAVFYFLLLFLGKDIIILQICGIICRDILFIADQTSWHEKSEQASEVEKKILHLVYLIHDVPFTS